MMENSSDDFHSTLEPDVIIIHDDELDEDEVDNDNKCENTNFYSSSGSFTYNINSEVSIIPINQSLRVKGFARNVNDKYLDNFKSNDVDHSSNYISNSINDDSVSKKQSLPLEKCPICKKYFRRLKTHLQKHEDIKRNPNDPYTCQFCPKSFNTGSNLSIHMRTHTGAKPYVCEVCFKGFSQSCNLVNHMRIHTGERPFKCPHCDRAFTQSGNLSNHVRLHTDEKPFKCHFCDKAFTQSGNLNSHIRNNHKYNSNVEVN